MGQAQREGGLYYVNGKAVDAEGREIKDAPKQPPVTPASEQPGAAGVTVEERIGLSIAKAIGKGSAKPEEDDDEETVKLPVIEKLPRALKKLKTRDEVEAMRAKDDRVGAQKHYDTRIEEIDEETKSGKK